MKEDVSCGATTTDGTAWSQRIETLEHDLRAQGSADSPPMRRSPRFLAVLCTFNLLGTLYQHQTTPDAPYRQPGTLREVVFLCGVVLGMTGREMVIKLTVAWGDLGKHNPLVSATLDWLNCTSPKLVPPKDRLPTGRLI